MTRHINFLVYSGFVLLDLSGPMEVFSWGSQMSAENYRLTVTSLRDGRYAVLAASRSQPKHSRPRRATPSSSSAHRHHRRGKKSVASRIRNDMPRIVYPRKMASDNLVEGSPLRSCEFESCVAWRRQTLAGRECQILQRPGPADHEQASELLNSTPGVRACARPWNRRNCSGYAVGQNFRKPANSSLIVDSHVWRSPIHTAIWA
jgi:hypothetical protein